jgi:plastocyanin
MSMSRSRTLASLAAVAVLALAGCGDSDDGGTDTGSGSSNGGGGAYGQPAGPDTATTPAAGGTAVSISDFKFMPPRITVPAGTKLEFSNDDTAAHTATANDRSFDTGSIRKGKKATVTLKKAGTFAYICDFHPYMKGTVVVE